MIGGDGKASYTAAKHPTLEINGLLESWQPIYRIGASLFKHGAWDYKTVGLDGERTPTAWPSAQPPGVKPREVFEFPGRHGDRRRGFEPFRRDPNGRARDPSSSGSPGASTDAAAGSGRQVQRPATMSSSMPKAGADRRAVPMLPYAGRSPGARRQRDAVRRRMPRLRQQLHLHSRRPRLSARRG